MGLNAKIGGSSCNLLLICSHKKPFSILFCFSFVFPTTTHTIRTYYYIVLRYRMFRERLGTLLYWPFSLICFHLFPTLITFLGSLALYESLFNTEYPLNSVDTLALFVTSGVNELRESKLTPFYSDSVFCKKSVAFI
jgi:hypothetical protein